MRFTTLVAAVALSLATTMGSVSAADQFAMLNGLKATPMGPSELDAIKGMHRHFFDANGGFHVIPSDSNGAVGQDNWVNLGGDLVHPSYHGLCLASAISITGPAAQCP